MCTFAHVIEVLTKKTKVTKRAEIQIRILALNFYITKMFTGQQYFLLIIQTKTPNLIGAQVVHFCLTMYMREVKVSCAYKIIMPIA